MFRLMGWLALAGAMAAQEPARIVWADEFNEPGLPDPAKWAYQTGGGGWGNRELQFYTAGRRENARVEDGRLIIEARREPWQGREYTSARLATKGRKHFLYGWFEIRAKLPCGRGSWPAIWMLGEQWPEAPWPAVGEIDIMEHVGFDPGRIHAAIHTSAYNHAQNTQKSASTELPRACEDFHVYALHWTPDRIAVYADGKPYFTFENERKTSAEWPFAKPQYLLLNVAVGGAWGGRKGVDDAAFPQRMEVDYVRVWDRKPE